MVGDGKRARSGRVVREDAADNGGAVSLWDVATGRELRRLDGAGAGINPGVAFSPDGKVLASGYQTEVRRWDTGTWAELPRFRLPSSTAGRGPAFMYRAALGYNSKDTSNKIPEEWETTDN